ncbi:MAG: HDOD domain-containing protein [Zoogloeaceae bacterium]|jgi:HD-like signal output (HDOD) protein|nr:HDOD domain-containing protein [Zoogloeaceae bacterium]
MDDVAAKALRGITIPSCPAILTQLMTELRSPVTSNKKIAGLIIQDVGIAAMVIRSANSPLISGNRRIESISDAVNLLGFGSLANLVHEALLQNSIGDNHASLERFWDSSRYTAIASSKLAAIIGHVSPDTAYTFGLFHDCGIPLLAQRYPDYKTVLREANQNAERMFTAIEDEAIGTSHAVLGYYLARSWGLSDAVTQGILNHHDYAQLEDPRNIASDAHRLIAINVIAEYVARTHLRTAHDTEWTKALSAVAFFFGQSSADISDLADDVIYQFDQALTSHDDD